jgi:hypothetical protein
MKNFTTDTFSHCSEYSSTWPKHAKGRRCFTILRRDLDGQFRGFITLEDERCYSVGISVCAGGRFLRLCSLAKTVSWTDTLESVSRFPSRHYAILHRSPKFADWNSNYIGRLSWESRRYEVGVRVLVNRHGEQILALYARPLHLNAKLTA